MKAICIDKFVEVNAIWNTTLFKINANLQNYNEVKVTEVSKPQRRDGEVLVQIVAAGVNFVDLLYVGWRFYYLIVFAIKPFIVFRPESTVNKWYSDCDLISGLYCTIFGIYDMADII